MKIEIDFPFFGYTKHDLIDFCYGRNAQVDVAIPIELVPIIQEFTGDFNGHFWYVMDYTGSNRMGKLTNLKEKFFEVVARKATSK
jgi:hypothetical protein